MYMRAAILGFFFTLPICPAFADTPSKTDDVAVVISNGDNGAPAKNGAKWIYVSKLPLNSDGTIDVSSGEGDKWIWYQASDNTFAAPTKSSKSFKLKAFTPAREFWPDDDSTTQIVVGYLVYQKTLPCDYDVKVNFAETARKSAIEQGIEFFLAGNKNPASNKFSASAVTDGICVYARPYTLQQARATLAITVTPPSQDTAGTGSDDSNPATVKASILTGSPEHWFFTTDVITTSMSQVTFDSTNNTFQEKSTPNNLNVGINYLFGDVYESDASATSGGRFGIKAFASTVHPKQLYGLGVGYLIPGNLFGNTSTGSVMVFVAYVVSKGDTGPALTRARLGLSFNLGSFSSGK